MAGVTNRFKYRVMETFFRAADTFYAFLITSAVAVSADINTKSELTEISGSGYTAGGISLTGNATDFDVLTEDDTNDKAFVQIRDLAWTASGGSIPTTGGARELALSDDNVTPASREVFVGWDLGSDRQVSDGQTLTIQNAEIDLS